MIFTKKELDKYILEGDIIGSLLYDNDNMFTSHKWLVNSLPKRAIYNILYGDLLESKTSKKILDIGGGFCSLTNILVEKHDYYLLDIMAHDETNDLGDFLIKESWYDFKPDEYDIVISNDLFPNVDQRLELFLKKYIPLFKYEMLIVHTPTPLFKGESSITCPNRL